MTSTVLLAGGGTAGHVVPSLATAAALRALRPELVIEFVGSARGLESRLVPAAGWTLHPVAAAPLRGRLSAQTLRAPVVVWRASSDVARLIRARHVAAACTFGGYVSGPLALGARRAGIPLLVHEQNAVPGLANRLAARWARTVAASVPGTETRFPHPERVVVTGSPVRPELTGADVREARDDALEQFGLDRDRFTLLAFGGSLGARRINDALTGSAALWKHPGGLQVLHLTGEGEHVAVRERWERSETAVLVRCLAFVDRMELAYAAADLALCRAGASTVAELTTVGLPSILVPYPHAAADEQSANARALAETGAAQVVKDEELSAQRLVTVVERMIDDPEACARAASAARSLGRPQAAEHVARLLLDAIDEAGR